MRLNCRITALLLCLTPISLNLGCTDKAFLAQKAEFDKLETALSQISAGPETGWRHRVEEVKTLDLKTPSLSRLRDLCTSAYDLSGDAQDELRISRKQLISLQKSLGKESPDKLKQQHDEIQKRLRATNDNLAKAKKLNEECMATRQKHRKEYYTR